MKAIVTGMIATYPVGGVVWDYAQYLIGLSQLGFEVYYLEDTGGATYDPRASGYTEDPTYGVSFLTHSLEAMLPGFGNRWHFRGSSGQIYGMSKSELAEAIAECDLFLNVSGGTLLRPEYASARRKVLIDTDPGWNHFVNYPKWDADPGWLGALGYRAHDYFFTYAERIGSADCPLPTFGLPWVGTRPPVATGSWSPLPGAETWTTVMTWDNFRRPIRHGNQEYGTKELEFVRIERLPSLVEARMEVAVGGDHAPRERWKNLGWSVIDSHSVSATERDYHSYICSSRGEFSVAKNVYAATHCGWFSCRSVCYLAAGRPVVVQDTGFSKLFPVGQGLLAFTCLEEAAAGVNQVENSYAVHQAAARSLALEFFDCRRVLSEMMGHIGLG